MPDGSNTIDTTTELVEAAEAPKAKPKTDQIGPQLPEEDTGPAGIKDKNPASERGSVSMETEAALEQIVEDWEAWDNANKLALEDLNRFLDGLRAAYAHDLRIPEFTNKEDSLKYIQNLANTFEIKTDLSKRAENDPVTFVGRSHIPGEYPGTYDVTPDSIVLKAGSFGPRQAEEMVELAALDTSLLKEDGIDLTGSPKQRALMVLAIDAYNEKNPKTKLIVAHGKPHAMLDLKAIKEAQNEWNEYQLRKPRAIVDHLDNTDPAKPENPLFDLATQDVDKTIVETPAEPVNIDDLVQKAREEAAFEKYLSQVETDFSELRNIEGIESLGADETVTGEVEAHNETEMDVSVPLENVSYTFSDPDLAEDFDLIARAETMEPELVEQHVSDDLEVTPLSDEEKQTLIQNTIAAKGIVPETVYDALVNNVIETGVATNKTIRSFLEEQGIPAQHLTKVTKDAVQRINKESFIDIRQQGATYRRDVNLTKDFNVVAALASLTRNPELETAIAADNFEFKTQEQREFAQAVLGNANAESSPLASFPRSVIPKNTV